MAAVMAAIAEILQSNDRLFIKSDLYVWASQFAKQT